MSLASRLRPTPWSELSGPRKALRAFNGLLFVSSVAMAVSAATASSDWELRSDDPPPARKSAGDE